MDREEEIIQLLQDIRKQQIENHDEWKKELSEAKLEHQKSVEEARKMGKSAKWKILLYIVAILVIFYLFDIGSFMLSRVGIFFTGNNYDVPSFLQQGKHYEANEWLSSNQSVSPFASNRFYQKENAELFVKSLYEAGAEGVYVINVKEDKETIEEEGGPYSDSLVVTLPLDKERRKKLFAIYGEECRREGFGLVKDVGQNEFFFWWD